MDKFDRIFQLHAILAARKTPIPLEDLTARLECSKATLHRAIDVLKDTLRAPVVFDAQGGGYRYALATGVSAFELPGLWFTPAELQALAVMQRLLKGCRGRPPHGTFGAAIQALGRAHAAPPIKLGRSGESPAIPGHCLTTGGPAFQTAASATLQRKQLWIEYHARGTDEHSERTISPQRVTHYRESWYLDAWDEGKQALRCFAIDRILRVTLLTQSAVDVSETALDAHYASAYGIFGGEADKTAVLRFTRERAQWVADEVWHPEQEGKRLEDGSYELRIPYRDHPELVMDILRHGPHVLVIEPQSLIDEVKNQLAGALGRYTQN